MRGYTAEQTNEVMIDETSVEGKRNDEDTWQSHHAVCIVREAWDLISDRDGNEGVASVFVLRIRRAPCASTFTTQHPTII